MVIPARDFYGEAVLVATGTTELQPERRHVQAIYRRLESERGKRNHEPIPADQVKAICWAIRKALMAADQKTVVALTLALDQIEYTAGLFTVESPQ